VGSFDDCKVVQGVLVALQAFLRKYRCSVTFGFKPDTFTLLKIKARNMYNSSRPSTQWLRCSAGRCVEPSVTQGDRVVEDMP